MNKKKKALLIMVAALLGFSCMPVLPSAVAPTLDPLSMNTAIAQTAVAASAQTAAVGQTEVLASPLPQGGPTLDANEFGTSVAQTAEMAATQTAALLPATLTPSVSPFPTETASTTPSPTSTFVLVIPTGTQTSTPFNINIPKSTATKKKKSDGGGGGGGGGGSKKKYGCTVMSVNPPNNTRLVPGQSFQIVWTVKNTESNWDSNSVDLAYAAGNIPHLTDGYDLPYTISGGDVAALPPVKMTAPLGAGTYYTSWQLRRGTIGFCTMTLSIVVEGLVPPQPGQ